MGSYLQGCVFARVSILFLSLKKKKPNVRFFFTTKFEWQKSSSTKEISIGTSMITCKYRPLQYINFFKSI